MEEEDVTNSVNVRALALDILIEVNEKNQYSHILLRQVLDKYQYLDKKERAFLTRLAEGTLECRIEMDFVIDAFSKTKVHKMKPFIRNLLRMSVYQLKYMDAVPDSAVCNEAVRLAKKRGFGQLSGFVNGVLRGIARGADPVDEIDREENPLRYLEVVYSMPRWIVEEWVQVYGIKRTESILGSFFKERPATVRTNLLKCTPEELQERLEREGVTVIPINNPDYAFAVSGLDYLNALESFREGWFYVQAVSSMMVVEAAEPEDHAYVIDVCAAPGGKSSHMAEAMHGTGMVEARDLTGYKVGLIEENIARHGLSNMKAVCMDATVHDEASVGKADILICDLPCSGLGVMGKKTDIRYKMNPGKRQELVSLQRQILTTVHDYVKPGGALLYSTCTIGRAENEENVEWFLSRYPEFTLCSQQQFLPDEGYHDGFFIARMVREDGGKP